jgi:hypothetical protein
MKPVGLGFLLIVLGLVAAGCRLPDDEPPSEAGVQFHDKLLRLANEYKGWGNVDNRFRVAPVFCAAPDFGPPLPRLSVSTDTETHGRKIYLLFVRKKDEYLELKEGQKVSVGQTVVKESYVAEEITSSSQRLPNNSQLPDVIKNQIRYRATKPADLFIMTKMPADRPGTDEGWVYGTVTPDAKTVTSAGKVESCMECHQRAKHDRLFGLPKD